MESELFKWAVKEVHSNIHKEFEATQPNDADKLSLLSHRLWAIQDLVKTLTRLVDKAKAHQLVEKHNERNSQPGSGS